jgi:hypothetical protein
MYTKTTFKISSPVVQAPLRGTILSQRHRLSATADNTVSNLNHTPIAMRNLAGQLAPSSTGPPPHCTDSRAAAHRGRCRSRPSEFSLQGAAVGVSPLSRQNTLHPLALHHNITREQRLSQLGATLRA